MRVSAESLDPPLSSSDRCSVEGDERQDFEGIQVRWKKKVRRSNEDRGQEIRAEE
jgi:hypothetical protein